MGQNDDSNEVLNNLGVSEIRSLHLFMGCHEKFIPRIQFKLARPKLDAEPDCELYSDTMGGILEQISTQHYKSIEELRSYWLLAFYDLKYIAIIL